MRDNSLLNWRGGSNGQGRRCETVLHVIRRLTYQTDLARLGQAVFRLVINHGELPQQEETAQQQREVAESRR